MKPAFKRISFFTGLCIAAALAASNAFAGFGYGQPMIRVTIKNLTRGQIFSPPLVVSHAPGFRLFETGEPASYELSRLAEDGNPTGLIDLIEDSPDVLDYSVSEGPVLPGQSVTIEVPANLRFNRISLAGMLVTTNDGFVAVRNKGIPFGKKSTTFEAIAYDAGSEANSEDCSFIPGPPCGNGGVHDPADAEGFVHIHAGIHGIGDLLPERDDWKNPVAEITLEYTR
jgi:hypothetical protein